MFRFFGLHFDVELLDAGFQSLSVTREVCGYSIIEK
jgi:hypothetical protein